MKRIVKKFFEIGAVILTGLILILMIWDYIYIPSNLGALEMILGANAIVFYIVVMALDSE